MALRFLPGPNGPGTPTGYRMFRVKVRWQLTAVLDAAVLAWSAATMPREAVRLEWPPPAPDEPPVVRGAYHVHSRASDGTGTMTAIGRAHG